VKKLVAVLFSLFIALSLPCASADDAVLTTFLEAKTLYKSKKYDDAEGALRRLGELLAAPEHAAERPKVMPAYYFYSAAIAFEKKDQERATKSLRSYFELVPNASLDKGAYPKAFSIFFDAEKTRFDATARAGAPEAGPQSTGGGVLSDYASYLPDPAAVPSNDGSPSWIDSPVRFLLTDEEKKAYRALADDDARRSFVASFWKKLDPRPETPENEMEIEFYRRAQYADAHFSTEGLRGSLSERGWVFLIMGPPSYAGRQIQRESEDLMTQLGNASNTTSVSLGHGAGSVLVHNDPAYVPNPMDGTSESWYYRPDRLPKGVPFNEIVFTFVTRRGYGENVLQKDARQLTTLAKVQGLIRENRLN
jgi:GWxTD domain-containing protein